MSLLSNTDILQLKEIGAIVIDPFNEKALNNTSVDMTLGDKIARYAAPHSGPFDLAKYEPRQMFRIEEARWKDGYEGRGFLLEAGERILGHTWEIAGGTVVPCTTCGGHGHVTLVPTRNVVPCMVCLSSGRIAVTTQLHATSTAARVGISVCMCAGFGDVGFMDRWCLEIANHSPRGLWLPVNAVICQVSFYRVTPPAVGTEYTKTGQYAQQSASPEEIHRAWNPERMLPKRLKIRPSSM